MDGWDSEEETGASAAGTAPGTNNEGPNNNSSQSNT
jgi:hypothetical protein